MKTLHRYLPLVLLAVFWEVAARLELVSSSALPPLSDVVVSWIDLIKTGELVGNTGASLYRAAMGLLLAIVVGTVLGIAWRGRSRSMCCSARWSRFSIRCRNRR